MKKIKIMLLSLALFAVVGGALAFKAKFNDQFCTTKADVFSAGLKCPNKIILAQFDNVPVPLRIYYTTTPVNGECPEALDCTNVPKVSLRSDD